jgi:hypothetical protein
MLLCPIFCADVLFGFFALYFGVRQQIAVIFHDISGGKISMVVTVSIESDLPTLDLTLPTLVEKH